MSRSQDQRFRGLSLEYNKRFYLSFSILPSSSFSFSSSRFRCNLKRKRVASRRVAVRSLRAHTAVRVVGSFYYQRTDSPGGRVVAHPLYAGHVHTARLLQTVLSSRTGKNRIFRFFRPEKGGGMNRDHGSRMKFSWSLAERMAFGSASPSHRQWSDLYSIRQRAPKQAARAISKQG